MPIFEVPGRSDDLTRLLGWLNDAGLSARIASPGREEPKMVVVGKLGITVSEPEHFKVHDGTEVQDVHGFDALVALLKAAL